MNAEQLLAQIDEDLSSDAEMLGYSRAIVSYLESKPFKDLQHLSFGRLEKVSGASDKVGLLRCIQYLSGARTRLLEYRFEYIEGDDIYEVMPEDVAGAQSAGVFPHPATGQLVTDYERNLSVYFVPGDNWKLLSHVDGRDD